MSTSSPTLVEMLIGAIPPQDGAALVARVGERARITSSSGAVEVGTAALTAEAFDALSKQLLPPEQLLTLQQTGTVEGDFVAPNGAGEFAVLASTTNGSPWIEVRRHNPTTAVDMSQAARTTAAPSVDTLVAELMSRSRSKSASSTTSAPARIAAQPAPTPVSAPAPVHVGASTPFETSTPPLPTALPDLDLASSPGSSNDDLTVPTNFDFVQSKFDPDDLSVSDTMVGERAAVSSGAAARDRAPVGKTASVTPPRAASPTLSDRLSAYGRLSILLPAAILMGIGLPVVGWFGWTAYFPSTPAPAPKAISRPAPPAAATVPQTTGVAATLQARSKMPRVPMHAPSISAPSISLASLSASVSPTSAAPAPLAGKEPPPASASAAPPNNSSVRSGFAVQVAAVRERDEANRMVATLVQQGYAGYVVNGEGAAAGFYRVRVGTFPTHEAAEAVANRIELTAGTKPWIVKETR